MAGKNTAVFGIYKTVGQAEQTVVRRAIPAPAASAVASTVCRPARNGPVPTRQTRTASVATAMARRAHHHATRRLILRRTAWTAVVTAGSAGRHG